MRISILSALFGLILLVCDLTAQSQFDALKFRTLGPTRGGRVTAVAGTADAPGTFFMGATGGGVWKTTDYGTTWQNVSDGYLHTPSIGAIRIAASDQNIVYVGTGSDGLRSNIITGKGVYKSTDAGKSWQHVGLKMAGQIGAVEIHPENPDVVFVAAIGQAFQANPMRGVFRSKNGGRDWEKVLFLSDTTGFTDFEFMPGNPSTMYASAWRTERKPWTILSGGYENGVFKSVDGGDTWQKAGKGLPDFAGKIDLAVSAADPQRLYALVEAHSPEAGLYRSDDKGQSFRHVSKKTDLVRRAFYYINVDADPTNADVVYVNSGRFLKSVDGGKNWERRSTPHIDNHDMWINPDNPNLFIQSNDGGANVTHNGGKTWSTQLNQPTAEIYQVEVDEQYPYWVYGGQQDNYSTISLPSLPPHAHQAEALGYMMDTGGCETGPAVPHPQKPHIVYSNCKGRFSVFNKLTGREMRYDVGAAYMYGHNPRDLRFRFQRVSPIHISPHDPQVIYHASQYVHRTRDEGRSWEIISPDLTAFEADKQVISGSPITRDITGEEFYSAIYSLRESSLEPGVIWVGANDGPVHVTRDNGENWQKVTPSDLPPGGRVDAVEPSRHQKGKAYIAVLRYQLGDWQPYLYKTEDYGKKWMRLTNGKNGIPADYPVRVVREDPDQPELLYAGTEFGLFVSFDDGANWQSFQQNLPVTPITDLKVHRKDVVLSTMGRGFWILDDISLFHDKKTAATASEAWLFAPRETIRYRYSPIGGIGESSGVADYPPPGVLITYRLPAGADTLVQLDILNDNGQVIRSFRNGAGPQEEESGFDMSTNEITPAVTASLTAFPGLNRFRWDMRHRGAWDADENRRYRRGPYAAPGNYRVRLHSDGKIFEQAFKLAMDPRVVVSGVSEADVVEQERLLLQIVDLHSAAKRKAARLQTQLEALPEKDGDEHRILKAQLDRLVRDEGFYTLPKLIDQISYLYGIINRGDQKPGEDVYGRYQRLFSELEAP